jgi:hypothetical protein
VCVFYCKRKGSVLTMMSQPNKKKPRNQNPNEAEGANCKSETKRGHVYKYKHLSKTEPSFTI